MAGPELDDVAHQAAADAMIAILAKLGGVTWKSRLGAVMSGMGRLERFLRTDPRDVGCDGAMSVLHVYVDLVAASQDAARRYPGVAAHLRARGPCGEDFTGLLSAVAGG